MRESANWFCRRNRRGLADGHNYLIPVGANIDSETDVKYKAVDAGYVLGHMNEADASLNIVILDTCRNNPYERSFRSASRGLVRLVGDRPGTLSPCDSHSDFRRFNWSPASLWS